MNIEKCSFNPRTKICLPYDWDGNALTNEGFTPGKASPEACQTECAIRYNYISFQISVKQNLKLIIFLGVENVDLGLLMLSIICATCMIAMDVANN